MNFETWEPVYGQILDDFGYPREGDQRAREALRELVEDQTDGNATAAVEETLAGLAFEGETVAVAGGAPGLEDDLVAIERASVVVAASNAAETLRTLGVDVDCMVTDLDKVPETAQELATEGVPVAVHAHGDNIDVIESIVPAFDIESVIPTTQARPTGPVYNFGGFTDGDRAAFLADAMGAERLLFPGWEFDDETVTAEKRQKLAWAARLLRWLERRRDEQFALLDGRRTELDVSSFG
ncbi:6-hydroxymethylpterin diphosphokinase MptE-like protein [Halovenus salina]|uniref:6-hydroxymethyl-7,8-dihydropterin pyrophosphokinase n=1 Tax=Halovenus salina TaxID=1510225 RepID=A0ABD5VZS1_9EURY|nr:6-hydroxymethylpterin diphosphokinase MptE-like protein [Halovenus salina]